MALQLADTLTESLALPEAYHRLDAFRFDQPSRVYVQIGVYATAADAAAGEKALKTKDFTASIDDLGGKENCTMAACYDYIKALYEYADATDV